MAQVERIHGESDHESRRVKPRGVPNDWFLDPADPDAAERYDSTRSLDDAATAFLEANDRERPTALAPVTELPLPAREVSLDEEDLADAGLTSEAPSEATGGHQVWIPLSGFLREAEEGELGWQTEALCAQTDPEAFFPEKGGSTRDAKKVCSSCTVRSECLEYALQNDERFGIWGGLSERERRRLRKRAN